MADYVFGVEIVLADHASPVVADATIGLYNITSNLSANASAGATEVAVADGTVFSAFEAVTVTDSSNSETQTVKKVVGNTVFFFGALANAYTTAASAKVDANSRFRWLQQAVPSVSGWCATMLVPEGIGKWSRQIDLKRGGNISQPGTCTVTIKNTAKFWDSLQDKSIYLNGMILSVYEFIGSTKTRAWLGVCEKPGWDAKQYRITAKGPHNRRKANIGTVITQAGFSNAEGETLGQTVPVTFGEFKPRYDEYGNVDYDSYAQFVRVASKVDAFKTAGTNDMGGRMEVSFTPDGQNQFPVVGDDGDTPPLTYDVKLGNSAAWYRFGAPLTSGTYSVTHFDGEYMHITDGDGGDAYRAIDHAWVDIDTDPTVIKAAIADYFEDTLTGNATATADSNSWLSIEGIDREYQSDVWPCRDYLGRVGATAFAPVDIGLNLYAYEEQQEARITVTGEAETATGEVRTKPVEYLALPHYAYQDSASGNKNHLDIDVKLFNGNPDQMDAFLILRPKGVKLYDAADNSAWSTTVMPRVADGLYQQNLPNPTTYTETNSITHTINQTRGSDVGAFRQSAPAVADSYQINLLYPDVSPTSNKIWHVIVEIEPPDIPAGYEFDALYMGAKVRRQLVSGDHSMYVRWRRFCGTATDASNSPFVFPEQGSAGIVVADMDSMPDFYFLDSEDTHNRNFYVSTVDTTGVTAGLLKCYQWSGYTNFELTGIDKDNYNSLYRVALLFGNTYENGLINNLIRIHELAFMFRKSISIKKHIYSPFQGRIYNDTWDGRRTAADLIRRPDDVMEHAIRLENFGESSRVPSNGWGLGYAEGAKIAYSGFGAFSLGYYGADLLPVVDMSVANQIQKYPETATDKIKRTLCHDFFMANWIDKDGFERISRVAKSSTSPSDSVTLADIVDRKAIRVTEPSPGDVYCEPYVRYQKNFANGSFQKAIRITDVDAETFDSSYVEGLTGYEAEEYWDRCHALWQKIGFITEPPKGLTDLQWANGDDGDAIAKEYLTEWIDWMFNPTVQFPVHYLKAGTWEEAHRFTLTLPHQTDSTAIECVVTKIEVNPNPPYHVTVTAVMFRETIPEDYFVKDTWLTLASAQTWVDTTTEYGDDNDKVDSM